MRTKYFRVVGIILACVITSLGFGQNLAVNFATPNLPSNVSDWSSNPALIIVTLTPGSGGLELENAHIVADVQNSRGKVLATTRDKYASQPPLNGAILSPTTYRWMDIVNPNAVTLDPAIGSTAARTGSLPDGQYKLCIYLVDANGQLISMVSSGCGVFVVFEPDPPMLLSPAEATTVEPGKTRFRWSPVQALREPVQYRFRIVEVLNGQSPQQACASNQPTYESGSIKATTLLYPSDAPAFGTRTNTFAWQVQAVNANNLPVGKNQGKSAIRSFKLKPDLSAIAGCDCGCGGTPRPSCAHKGCVCSKLITAAGNGCTCGCGGTPRPYCAHADCKCAKARAIIGDSAVAVGAGNGCDCGCGGTPRPYCAYKDCKCAKTEAVLPDNTTLTSAGTTCTCGCGGTPRPYCAHKDCQCAKAGKITGDQATPVTSGNGCTCGCGGTPRPYCAYRDCKCAQAKAILPDNTGTVLTGNGCTCGCGGTPRPLCAHKECKCAQTDATTIGTATKGNGCDCGCGGTPRPLCAHKNCKCAKDE